MEFLKAPNDYELIKLRTKLELLYNRAAYRQIAQNSGIHILELRQRRHPDEDCAAYALGMMGAGIIDRYRQAATDYVNTTTPVSGDLVLYYNNRVSWPCHLGIFRDTNTVHSKWDIGHVYEHKLFYVPIGYGNWVRFVENPTGAAR